MKKILLVLLCIICSLSVIACYTDSAHSPTTTANLSTNENTTPPSTTFASATTDETPTSTPSSLDITEPEFPENMGDAPYILMFSSLDDIKAFRTASLGSETDFDNYMKTATGSEISQDIAQKIAVLLSSQQYPTQTPTDPFIDFGASYYFERNTLHLGVVTQSVRYRFIYYFGQDPELTFTGTPVISNVDLGIAKLDLYQGDGALVGTYSYQNAVVQVIVYTDNPNSVSLDSIGFASIK